MIWAKTDAGRAEVQSKALIKERSQRNLLLLIDGQKSEDMLLSGVAGITLDREARQQAFSWTHTGGVVQLRGRGILTSDFRDLNGAGQITGIFRPELGAANGL